MFVIPSVDIKEGKVVRIMRGDPRNVIISVDDPVKVAKTWVDKGAKFVHVVDLDAAFDLKSQTEIILDILEIGANFTVGGGIRDFDTAKIYIENGAWAVVISTMIFENTDDFEKLASKYPDKVIVALDFDEEFHVMIRGWKLKQKVKIFDMVELLRRNIKGFLFTSTFRDGTNLGIPKEHFRKITEFMPETGRISIASGGISSTEDLIFLKDCGFWGAVVGRAFYEGKINIFEI